MTEMHGGAGAPRVAGATGLSRRVAITRLAAVVGAGLAALSGLAGAEARRRRESNTWTADGGDAETQSTDQSGQDSTTGAQGGTADQGGGGTSRRQDTRGTDTFGRTVTADPGIGGSTTGTNGTAGADGTGASGTGTGGQSTTDVSASGTPSPRGSGRTSGRSPSRGDS